MSSESQGAEEALALVAYAAGDLRLEHRALTQPRPDETVVRIAYGGICGSDLHYWSHGAAGESILREPMVLGHEIVGTVEVGAADGSGPGVGTPVAVHPATPLAGTARYPLDRPNLSPAGTYLGSAAHTPHTQGAFAERVVLPSRMLRPLPASLPLRRAALVEPASVAWHAVLRAGGESLAGRRVLVVGCGPIGLLIIAVLRRFGVSEITAVDLHAEPLERARSVGATQTLLSAQAEQIDLVDADVSLESSGNVRGLASAIRATTRGGRVVMVGLIPSGDASVPISTAITRELELIGSFRFADEIDEVIAALADGSLRVDRVITHEFPAPAFLDAFRVAADSSVSSKVLIGF